jgi:hypothetical protein
MRMLRYNHRIERRSVPDGSTVLDLNQEGGTFDRLDLRGLQEADEIAY